MTLGTLSRILPCRHLFHERCVAPITGEANARCPYCRGGIEQEEQVLHQKYSKHSSQDRQRIVEIAERGDDWKALAESLNINYKTAYGWVRSGEIDGKRRGGYKKKYISEEQLTAMLHHLEKNP